MKRHKWTFMAMLGLAAWLAIASGQARAGVIFPVDPAGKPDLDSSVSISIINPTTGADMTDYWLPVPEQTVKIVVNGSETYTISLEPSVQDPVLSGALITSAYPGRMCKLSLAGRQTPSRTLSWPGICLPLTTMAAWRW